MLKTKKGICGLGKSFYSVLCESVTESRSEKLKKLKDERNTYIQRIQKIDREIEKLCNEKTI